MKTNYVLLPAIMIIVLAMTVFGQQNHDGTTQKDMKKHLMMSMMGKPTVDATVEGLHMTVWLMTQKHHKKMMKVMKHDDLKMDKTTMEVMMAGTHHMMLHVTDVPSGKEITDAGVKVLIVSPSKKNSSVELKPVMNHFGDGLTLTEKGEYQFNVIVKVDGVPKATQFKYKVK